MAEGTRPPTLPVSERLRSWISKYNIIFEGPLPSRNWPHQYEDIFRSIRDIDRIRFEEYTPNGDRGLLTVSEMKARVVNINKIAYICRRARANESTWRLKMEHWILWRFDAEVACHKCRKRLWISEFQTLPNDPDRAEELRVRRAERVLCNCSPSERAMVDRWERGQTRVFADRADDFVLHQDSMELLGCGVKERRPDRIFGLENTAMFDRYISNKENERFRHSPFADGKVLYPFLVIEAKSEKGSPGFESIESQTAFPIRSLLQLQDRLARHSEIEMNPLLWFLANQGDEWRVYAAVMNSSKFRVFDLWHGTILSQDCALQLLLIIDSICEWARDIYRLDVLRCLSGGQLDLRAVTPAWSTTQSQHESRSGSDEPSSSSAGTVTPQVESPPPLATLADPALDHLVPELDVAMIDMDVFDDDLQQVPPMIADSLDDSVPRTGSIYPDTSQALLRYDKSHPNAPKWTELGTIQHSNLVQFKFQYCMIPDTFASFCQFLTDANEPENLAALAREILSTFESNYSILTEISTVTELAELWVEDATLLKGLDNSSNNLVQVIVKFNTYFDIGSWQTIRVLDCFVCSQTAWNLLIMVSRLVDPRANDPWMSDRRADLCLHVQPLKTLHGKDATAAALQNLDTVLCIPASADSAKTGLIWREYNDFPEENQFIFRGNLWQRVDDSWRYFRWTSKQRELHPTSSGPLWLQSMIQTHKMKSTYGAILLRKPPTWPETCPFFCLAVFDPVVDFESERKVGRLLDQVLLANDIYVVSDDESKPRTFSDVDFRACHLWSNILAGDALAETPWPVMQ